MKLYEIDQMIADCVDLETGEIIDMEMLEHLQMERDEKIKNVALWMKNLKSEIAALKAEKEAFAERQRTAENAWDGLKQWLAYALKGESMKRPEFTVSFRRTVGTNILNEEAVPEIYKVPQPAKLDKATILKALKAGVEVPGVELKEGLSMTLK